MGPAVPLLQALQVLLSVHPPSTKDVRPVLQLRCCPPGPQGAVRAARLAPGGDAGKGAPSEPPCRLLRLQCCAPAPVLLSCCIQLSVAPLCENDSAHNRSLASHQGGEEGGKSFGNDIVGCVPLRARCADEGGRLIPRIACRHLRCWLTPFPPSLVSKNGNFTILGSAILKARPQPACVARCRRRSSPALETQAAHARSGWPRGGALRPRPLHDVRAGR